MSGPQFVHLQTFSRKPNPAGQCVAQILGELARVPEFSLHVEAPRPPQRLDGLSPEELVKRHDKMIEDARVKVRVKGKIHHRAVRKDRHTLMTAVASYPLTWDQITGNPEEETALRRWEVRNVAFFKKLFGEQYQAVYRHTDEPYPHLHIYALPELTPGVDATTLHPGKRAKAQAEAKALKGGAPPRVAVGSGNRALKSAMRRFQDVYFLQVGEPCGLLRTGPKRQRLSRKDYLAQKAAARLRSLSTLEARRNDLDRREGETVAASERAARVKDQLDRERDNLVVRGKALADREVRIDKAEKRMAQYIRKVHRLIDSLGVILGIGAFKSIREGLSRLEETAASLQMEVVPNTGEPEDNGCGPSW